MGILKKVSMWVLALPLVGCTTVPTSIHDTRLEHYSPKITANDFDYNPYDTPIAQCYIDELKSAPEISGATLIEDGLSAFVIRSAFARMATKTIDLQTYIYSNDFTSRVLIAELKNAADRGVKVRILLDDYGTKSDSQEHVERSCQGRTGIGGIIISLFVCNPVPWENGNFRSTEYASDNGSLDREVRRMYLADDVLHEEIRRRM